MNIELIGSDVLNKKAQTVTEFDDNLANKIEEMTKALKKSKGVGLAAPQVGLSERIFLTDAPNDEVRVFINPEIISTSLEECYYEEGCLSIPGVYFDVKRPEKITIQAQKLNGRPFKLEIGGYLARIIQHEFDHLKGILFIEYADEATESKYEKKIKRIIKRNK